MIAMNSRLRRRLFTVLLALAGLAEPALANERVRVMAANLTSGRHQSYDPGHGTRMIEAIKPDVVLIQEFNYGDNSDGDIRAFIDEALGSEYQYFREEARSATIPNGIISRFPIKKSGAWRDSHMPNRGFSWAALELPDGRLLWAYSVHLSAKRPSTRADEARELVELISNQVDVENDLIVIGGDFNTAHAGESALKILSEVVGNETHPSCPIGRTGTNQNRNKPYDWVMANDAFERYHVGVTLGDEFESRQIKGTNYFPEGLVFDLRAFRSNPFAGLVEPEDFSASGMQHMGVVKDFVVTD